MSNLKKVLWVTSFFPPRVSVATVRNVKFLKYLPSLGWEAVVVSPIEGIAQTEISQKLLNQLGQSIVIANNQRDLHYWVQKKKYLGYLFNNVLPPDGHIFWVISLLFHIKKIITEYQPDMVFTTCSPFSLNLVGAWVKRTYHLPWVTDFRDLWTLNPNFSRYTRVLDHYNHFVSEFLESFTLQTCDALIVTSSNSQRRMVEKYPFLTNKTWVIPNGFDQDDILPCRKIQVMPNTLFYAGAIYGSLNYSPLAMLKLLSKLAERGYFDSFSWEIHYAGRDSQDFIKLVNQTNLQIECKIHGYLDHARYYALIQQMEYVFFCMPEDVDTTSWVPARLYDYIGNRVRIIGFVSRGSDAARLLEQYGNSLIIFYDEHPDVQSQKLAQYLLNSNVSNEVPDDFVNSFSRKELTVQLVQVFETVVNLSERSN